VKWSVATLAASTAVLAGCTVYLARELALERNRNAAALVESGPQAGTPGMAGRENATSSTGESLAATASTPEGAHAGATAEPASIEDRRKARNKEQAEEFLRRYDNPETRAKLLQDQVQAQRRGQSGLRSALDIDARQFDRLINLYAEQELDRRARMARCLTDVFCVRPNLVDRAERRQAAVEVIGEEKTARLEQYRSEQSRSSQFGIFQARLGPQLALSPQQLDELSTALFEEQARARQEIESHGHEYRNFATTYGVIVYSTDTNTLEERMASAAASVSLMRDRAGALLNSEQLEVFNQMQDDSLLVFRPYARVMMAARELGYDWK
jgi:hypothetical protein